MTKVWRPDIREDSYRLQVDSQILFYVVQGLREQATQIREEIWEHETTCGKEPTYCLIRYKSLVEQYGSVEEVIKQTGMVLYDCMESLSEMHMTLGKVLQSIHAADKLLRNPEAYGDDPDRTDWRPVDKLREIQKEVTHRTEASKEETGLMPAIKDDEQDSDAGEKKSLLGLTEKLPKETKKK